MKARIIIPVWGTKYIKRLDAACLPALLAPGNLPHLAEHFECELVIVTESTLFEMVRKLPSIQLAIKYASLRLVPIDDMLSHPSYYGLTITHALYRGFTDLGDAARDVWCLFLNADFILADGSYRSLVKRMQAGERCILSPSYCTIEEEVLPGLTKTAEAGGGVLSVIPRDMAAMILEHKHFTIRAKIINWKMYRIDRVDQFYYQLDNDTLIGLQLPIAVVAFRPERVPPEPVTFWDYGVVSEICPTSALCVLGDSDDFLMLELRGRETMKDQLSIGWMNPEEIAKDLSIWTTKDQRDCGEFSLVLHRSDLPSNYEQGLQALETHYRDIMRRVAPTPRDYRHHYIWTGMAQLHANWLRSRQALTNTGTNDHLKIGSIVRQSTMRDVAPPKLLLNMAKDLVLAPFRHDAQGVSQTMFDNLREICLRVFGRQPDIQYLHPHWIDLRPVHDLIKDNSDKQNFHALGVWAASGAAIAPYLDRWIKQVSSCRPNDILRDDGLAELGAQGPFNLCILELDRNEFLDFSKMHARLRSLVRKDGHIIVLYRTRGIEQVLERDFQLIANGLPNCDFSELEIRGTVYSIFSQRLWERARQLALNGGALNLIWLFVIALLMILSTVMGNRASRKYDLGSFKNSCTSLLLKVKVT